MALTPGGLRSLSQCDGIQFIQPSGRAVAKEAKKYENWGFQLVMTGHIARQTFAASFVLFYHPPRMPISMNSPRIWVAVLLMSFASGAMADALKFPIAGKFYTDEDDSITIFLNGKRVHHGDFGTAISEEVALMPTDRLVVDLWNQGGPYGLKVIFVSTDRKTIINFGANSFRILRDPEKKDFNEKEFSSWKDVAHRVNRSSRDLWLLRTKQNGSGEKRKSISATSRACSIGTCLSRWGSKRRPVL